MKFAATLADGAVLQELGERLAQCRLSRNLSQDALAAEAGISLRTLSRLETGEPSQTVNLLRVLRALGLLENLETLVPPPMISPLQQLKLQGKTRKRASRQGAAVAEPNSTWQWQPE